MEKRIGREKERLWNRNNNKQKEERKDFGIRIITNRNNRNNKEEERKDYGMVMEKELEETKDYGIGMEKIIGRGKERLWNRSGKRILRRKESS